MPAPGGALRVGNTTRRGNPVKLELWPGMFLKLEVTVDVYADDPKMWFFCWAERSRRAVSVSAVHIMRRGELAFGLWLELFTVIYPEIDAMPSSLLPFLHSTMSA